MKFIIDRFEGNYAVVELENKIIINVPRSMLPKESKEGSVISIVVDQEETEKRKNNIKKLTNDLWK